MLNSVFKAKRSQFYLLTGFVFIFLVFSLNNGVFYIPNHNDPFVNLKMNYVREINKVINEAILNDEDVFYNVNDYTKRFLRYAKTRGVNMGLVFVLSQGGNFKIVNYLNDDINIYYENNRLLGPIGSLSYNELTWRDKLTIVFEDNKYTFHFSDPSNVEIKVLFRGEIRS